MGVNIYFSLEHAEKISKSIETATYAMFDNSPDDADYLDILHKVVRDLSHIKDQLDAYIGADDQERRLSHTRGMEIPEDV